MNDPLPGTAAFKRRKLTRFGQPPSGQTLTDKVPLNSLVVSLMKQQLPVLRAVELTSLNRSFAQTEFLKPTLHLQLANDGRDTTMLSMLVKEERNSFARRRRTMSEKHRENEGDEERERLVPIDKLAVLLKNIADNRIVRTLKTTVSNDRLHKMLLELEKLTPSRLTLWQVYGEKSYQHLVPLLKRLSSTVQKATFSVHFEAMDYQQFERCLTSFTNLQRLHLWLVKSPSSSFADWLKKAIMANGQLKRLSIRAELFFSPVITGAISTIASVGHIHIHYFLFSDLCNHVEMDLCGTGQCTLTELMLAMPLTGRLALTNMIQGRSAVFSGDLLRICYYLLRLHNTTGRTMVVEMALSLFAAVDEFLADLAQFFHHPPMETKTGNAGSFYRYRVRVGTVIIYLCEDNVYYRR